MSNPYDPNRRFHQPQPKPEPKETKSREEGGYTAEFNGPGPKLLYIDRDGYIYELDNGMLPDQNADKAILSGFIGAVTNAIQERWFSG